MATRPVNKFVHPSYVNPGSHLVQDPRINQETQDIRSKPVSHMSQDTRSNQNSARPRPVMSSKPSGIKLPSSVNGGTRMTPPSQQITPEVLVNLDQIISSPALPSLPLPPRPSQSSQTNHEKTTRTNLGEHFLRLLQNHASTHNAAENTLKLPWVHPGAINMVDRLILIQGRPSHLNKPESEEKSCKWVRPRLFDLEPIFEFVEIRDSPLVWTRDYLNIHVKIKCSSTILTALEELGYKIRYDTNNNLYLIETNAIRTGLIVLLLSYILDFELPMSQGRPLKDYLEKELSNEWARYESHRDITKLTLHRTLGQLLADLK